MFGFSSFFRGSKIKTNLFGDGKAALKGCPAGFFTGVPHDPWPK